MSFRDMINSKTNTSKNKKELESQLKQEQIEKNVKTFNESNKSMNMIKSAINKASADGLYYTSLNYHEMLDHFHNKEMKTKNVDLNCNFLCSRIKKELGLDCDCISVQETWTKSTHICLKWD